MSEFNKAAIAVTLTLAAGLGGAPKCLCLAGSYVRCMELFLV